MASLCLFGGAAVFAAMTVFWKKGRSLWALPAAVCVASGVLAGLVLGQTLPELLTPVLAVCAVAMAALLWGRGGGGE